MAHKAIIKNELKQVLSIAVQRCHALSLEKGANYLAGRLAEEQRADARRAQAACSWCTMKPIILKNAPGKILEMTLHMRTPSR